MKTNPHFFNRLRLWSLVGGLALLVAQLFTPLGLGCAQWGLESTINRFE
jgi:hypothetical protein